MCTRPPPPLGDGIGTKKENQVLLAYVWDASKAALHNHPYEYYRILFGATSTRIKAVQQCAKMFSDCEKQQKEEVARHGNLGKDPANKTSTEVMALIDRHLSIYAKGTLQATHVTCTFFIYNTFFL